MEVMPRGQFMSLLRATAWRDLLPAVMSEVRSLADGKRRMLVMALFLFGLNEECLVRDNYPRHVLIYTPSQREPLDRSCHNDWINDRGKRWAVLGFASQDEAMAYASRCEIGLGQMLGVYDSPPPHRLCRDPVSGRWTFRKRRP